MICPSCNGEKRVAAFVDCADRTQSGFRALPCSTCKGAGEISDDHAERITAGRLLRDDRVARRLSQREEAARLGITAQELNAREHGRQA